MVGSLKKGPSDFTHLLVVVKCFLDIIYQFGVPNCIVIDHETNFTEKKFLDFNNRYGIRID